MKKFFITILMILVVCCVSIGYAHDKDIPVVRTIDEVTTDFNNLVD